MRMNFRRACTVALSAAALLSVILLPGCSEPPRQEQKPTPPPLVNPKPRETVEMMPSSSEEFLRRHILDANGFEIETRIEYRNGDKAVIKMRPDSTQAEYRRVTKDGTVKVEQIFAADGKTVVRGQELRDDGTMKLKTSQDASGLITAVTYWYDGQRVFTEKKHRVGGAYETTYYYKDGNVWMKRSGPADGTVDKETLYDRTGKVQFVREKKPTEVVVTVYGANGKPSHRQHVVEKPSQYGSYVNKTMLYVEEFAADGTTVTRKFVMTSDGWSLDHVVRFNDDGTTTVRKLGGTYDPIVTREEQRDAAGNVTSTKTFTSSDNVREQYDRGILREQYTQDPQSTWDSQERYPNYRNQP